jgi:hypothetical protein
MKAGNRDEKQKCKNSLLYFVAQRYFIEGITFSGVKG